MPGETVISIVDDDEAAREGVTDLIGSLGFSARSFTSGEDFLNSDQLHSTSCLIADMQMPGMTGLELHDRLVASGFAIPTLVITAYPDEGTQERAIKAGVICYLIKPFDVGDFLDCVRSALTHTRPARADR